MDCQLFEVLGQRDLLRSTEALSNYIYKFKSRFLYLYEA